MSNVLTIFINDEAVFEQNRDINLEQNQLEFLDNMDDGMNRGIKIAGELIKQPDLEHRIKFVSLNLIKALQQDNNAIISASCAYLIHRRPELMEIRASDGDRSVIIDLVDEQI